MQTRHLIATEHPQEGLLGAATAAGSRPMQGIVRFGAFEVDLFAGQLRKGGLRIRLRDQSFQVLACLLERPGEVVTRGELRRRLWPEEVFVDFDNNLNTAVARLREALNDSADHPRFVETLPKHGYRFIAKGSEVDLGRLTAPSAVVAAVTPRPTGRGWMAGAALGAAALLAALVALNVGGLRNRLLGRAGPPRIESLAVLPLVNVSRDPDQEFFADGMTDALITELAKISALKVISRTSVMHYKKTDKTAPQIAAELNVDGLLEGTVEREGNQVRINVQLVHGPSDKHLWAQTYQRELPGILALQSEVAQAIAQEVRASLTPEEHRRLSQAPLVDPQAYEAYLKGRHFWETRTRDGLQKALEYFQTAIRIAPSCALAYTGLADTYSILGDHKFLEPDESFPKARAAAQRALELNENLAEAHAAMALVLHAYDWDWQGGEREINRAIQLNPGYASAHHWHGLFLSQIGRHTEALVEIRTARSLDPLSPLINLNFAAALAAARQYEQAIREFRKAIELYPDNPTASLFLGDLFSTLGRHEEAIAQIRRSLALHRNPVTSLVLARAFARAGRRQEAKKIIEAVLKAHDKKYFPPPLLATVYATLGEKDEAFAWLEKGYAEHDSDMEALPANPAFDPLRSDPRFTALLRKMNLQP
jgi:TolB-like protein/DNA-binding winged helix-turn-helix (wHTH) protein/Tfp pilus assembly protein PilF